VGKTSYFRAKCVNISKMIADKGLTYVQSYY